QQPYYPNYYYYQQPTYQYQYPNTYVNADPPATPAAEQYSAPPAMPAQAIITPGFVYVNGKAIPVGTTAGALASNTEVQRLEAKQKVLENKVTAMQKELTVMKRAETQTSSKQP
ncbi:MAG: hypothetical protein M1321_02085, partial [Candidatus Marsarchaeota archaeon]|nr:hypothetical protein [Candidatus Marsarchaeota archaeon]